MLNTGWVTSFNQTALPMNSTMWFVNIMLLCYLVYYVIRKVSKNNYVYLSACTLMALVGWVCLEHSPGLPFLWSINGRGYAPFFLGTLLYEFQDHASEKLRKDVSVVWVTLILGFLLFRLIVGFERVFGRIGGSPYVRYFEFIAAPGLLLGAMNLSPVRKCLEWKPVFWLGTMSGAIYYVHNNIMEDYRILSNTTGIHVDFSAGWVFLAVLISILPFALLWQYVSRKLSSVFLNPTAKS